MTARFTNLLQNAVGRSDHRGRLDIVYESGTVALKRAYSKKGVMRGLHIQRAPYLQTKIFRVISGRIIDFIVDMRTEDKDIFWEEFGPQDAWIKVEPYFAHGYYALEDCVFEYLCDGPYNEDFESAFSIADFLDRTLKIQNLIISEKDQRASSLKVTAQRN